jgi:hypothetical protein
VEEISQDRFAFELGLKPHRIKDVEHGKASIKPDIRPSNICSRAGIS